MNSSAGCVPVVEDDPSFWHATMRNIYNCSGYSAAGVAFPLAFVNDGWGNVDAVVRRGLGFRDAVARGHANMSHMLHVTRHTRHTSHVTRHTSHVLSLQLRSLNPSARLNILSVIPPSTTLNPCFPLNSRHLNHTLRDMTYS